MKTFRIIKKLSQLGRIGYYYFNLTYVLKTRLFELKFLMKKKKRNFTLIQLNFIKIKTMQVILSFYNYDSYNKLEKNSVVQCSINAVVELKLFRIRKLV